MADLFQVRFDENQLPDVDPVILRRNMGRAMSESMFEFTNAVKDRMVPYTGKSRANKLQVRTGALRNSIGVTRVTPARGVSGVEVTAFTTSKYAPVHELGATITPNPPRQYLTIPLEAALLSSGDFDEGARMVKRSSGWETQDGRRTRIAGRTGRKVILAEKRRRARGARVRGAVGRSASRSRTSGARRTRTRATGDSWEPLYALRERVKIPGGRLHWVKTWKKQRQNRERRLIAAVGQSVLESEK